MKIGILTFWTSNDNYGQLLQCYALQKHLRDAGHDVFLIRYDRSLDLRRTPVPLWRKLLKVFNPNLLVRMVVLRRKGKERSRQAALEWQNHPRGFDAFRSRYLGQSDVLYRSWEALKAQPPEADCYIVGSDQVWNFYQATLADSRGLLHAFFLDFGKPETLRMAYAASWGKTQIGPDFCSEIRPLLATFNYVSVREKSGISLCRSCGYENAEFRCDPTLLLPAEAYRELTRKEQAKVPDKKYVLVYRLGNPCVFDVKKVEAWATGKGLRLVYVTANALYDSLEKTYPTIPEWLALVEHAEYVITNSFHCCVFSLLFQRKFAAVPLTGKAIGMNSRMDTLFELFHVKPRWFTGDFSVLEEPVHWQRPDIVPFDVNQYAGNV